jgi:hypothetical protein
MATFLHSRPDLIPDALARLRHFDRQGEGFYAAVIATALGQLPSEATAIALAGMIGDLRSRAAVKGVAFALGQNRYGTEVPPGSWTASSMLADVRTPIIEQEVIAALVRKVDSILESPKSRDQALVSELLQVLAYSQASPEVAGLIRRLIESEDRPTVARQAAFDALGYGFTESAHELLKDAVETETDPGTLRSAASSLARHSTPSGLSTILARIENPGFDDPEEALAARVALWDGLAHFAPKQGDPTVTDLETAIRTQLLDSRRPSRSRMAALPVASRLVVTLESRAVYDAVASLMSAKGDALSLRVATVQTIHPGRSFRTAHREALFAIALDSAEPTELRTVSLGEWARLARHEEREVSLSRLSELATSATGNPDLQTRLAEVRKHLMEPAR